MNAKTIDCTELDDVSKISLKDMRVVVLKLINKYGEDASSLFDAGYNNISVSVEIPSRK